MLRLSCVLLATYSCRYDEAHFRPQGLQIIFEIFCHRFGVNALDSTFVLKGDQFAQIISSLLPGDTIGDKKEDRIVPLFLNNAGNVA